jgi:DNA-binding NarL/FixJ family response regulator
MRILIADDHAVVRRGVRAILEGQAGWTVCGEASTGREAVAMALTMRPDVIVLDLTMPELNGLEATRQLRRLLASKIVILTVHQSNQVVAEVIAAGAHGYVVKADAGQQLVEAIRTIALDLNFVSERLHMHADHPGVPGKQRAEPLTPREREVLQLLSEGKSNKEIGTTLRVTTKTAETHRAHIMAKLGIHSMAALVRYAIRNRVIDA